MNRWSAAADALQDSYATTSSVVQALQDEDFRRRSRCEGWTVRDVLFHQLLDARRALVAVHTTTDDAPTTDAVAYWRGYEPGMPGAAEHAEYVRVSAAAYPSAQSLARQWLETSAATARAVRDAARTHVRIRTQGLVLNIDDFACTLVVEATIHLLDMTVDLSDPVMPAQSALTMTRAVLDGLLEAKPPAAWDDTEYVLKATGREPLTDADRAALGTLLQRLPLLG